MSEFEDSMTYCLWSCACAAQQAKRLESATGREEALNRAVEFADKAWAIYYEQFPKVTEPTEPTSEVAQ